MYACSPGTAARTSAAAFLLAAQNADGSWGLPVERSLGTDKWIGGRLRGVGSHFGRIRLFTQTLGEDIPAGAGDGERSRENLTEASGVRCCVRGHKLSVGTSASRALLVRAPLVVALEVWPVEKVEPRSGVWRVAQGGVLLIRRAQPAVREGARLHAED